jgi:hypothetical protein
MAASDSDIGTYGTGTMSSRNFKLFMVGFIPPDNPINYIAFTKTSTQVGNTQLTAKSAPTGVGIVNPNFGTGSGGAQPITRQTVGASDLRQAIFNSYQSLTGQVPTEATISLIYAQIAVENGKAPGAPSFGTNNFNLGNTHAGGRSGKYLPGTVPNNSPSATLRDQSANIDPSSGYRPPSAGTWYVGTDFDGKGVAYPANFQAFSNLNDAVQAQVGTLLTNWPGTGTAQTPADFVAALQPGGGHNYFEASPGVYQRGIDIQQAGYYSLFPTPLGTPATTTTTVAPSPEAPGAAPSGIMSPNVMMGDGINDPLSLRLGRSTQVADQDAQQAALAQTNALRAQINTINSTPPLLMLINPNEFTRSYEQSADDSAKTRYGNVVHLWLERPLSISCSGTSAGQYVVDSDGNGGLTTFNRIQSIGYQNLLSLVMTYKNNGILFAGGEIPADLGVSILGMSLFIYYDDHLYIGSFDDFEVNDDADKPFNLSYNFKFNVRYDVEMTGTNEVTDVAVAAQFGAYVTAVSTTNVVGRTIA